MRGARRRERLGQVAHRTRTARPRTRHCVAARHSFSRRGSRTPERPPLVGRASRGARCARAARRTRRVGPPATPRARGRRRPALTPHLAARRGATGAHHRRPRSGGHAHARATTAPPLGRALGWFASARACCLGAHRRTRADRRRRADHRARCRAPRARARRTASQGRLRGRGAARQSRPRERARLRRPRARHARRPHR